MFQYLWGHYSVSSNCNVHFWGTDICTSKSSSKECKFLYKHKETSKLGRKKLSTFLWGLPGMNFINVVLSLQLKHAIPKPWIILYWMGLPCNSYIYTGCNRRNGPDFGRVFHMLNYTDITQNTYIQSWTVTEIMAIEMCGLLGCRRTVRRPWRHTCPTHTPARDMVMHSAYGSSDVTR